MRDDLVEVYEEAARLIAWEDLNHACTAIERGV